MHHIAYGVCIIHQQTLMLGQSASTLHRISKAAYVSFAMLPSPKLLHLRECISDRRLASRVCNLEDIF